jgi:prolyl 4-hydroxylase
MTEPKADTTTPTEANAKEVPTESLKDDQSVEKKPQVQRMSSLSLMVAILVAMVSLLAGIVTPTLWNGWLLLQDDSSPSSPQRELVTPLQERKTLVETRTTTITSTATPQYACTDDVLADYLHDFLVPGLHVVCWQDDSWTMYPDARHTNHPQQVVVMDDPSVGSDWPTLRDALVKHLTLTPTDQFHQPWAIYSPTGERLLDEVAPDDKSIARLQDLGLFLVYQGGQWLWPPIRKGYTRHIQLDDTHNATLETLSIHPLVLSVQGFLSSQECDTIQQEATPSMQYSSVTLMDHDQGRPASDFRTSQSTFLPSNGNAVLTAIDDRTASLVRLPKSHQEYAQVLRYGHLEKYDTHHDYFDPSLYQKDVNTLNLIGHGRRNRMATVFWYLTTVEQGGETVFPRFDKGPHVSSQLACQQSQSSTGLKVKPERGKVIIFYNLTPEGKTDVYSLHGACPVLEGIKWAANKWVWNEAMGYMRD